MPVKKQKTIQSYETAAAAFESRPRGDSKRLHKNCRLHRVGDNYVVRYYYTDIVTYYPDGTFTLNCGGWPTMSTRDWIEATAPAFIRQKTRSGKSCLTASPLGNPSSTAPATVPLTAREAPLPL